MVDAESAKRVGKLLRADAILTGTITELSTFLGINCRVVDGLTGEIRGAAGVKIAKDEDVNKIIAATSTGKDQTDRKPTQTPARDTAPPKSSYREVVNGFAFDLKGCSALGNSVDCDLQITSLGADRTLRLYARGRPGSRLIDVDGNEFQASAIEQRKLVARRDVEPSVSSSLALIDGIAVNVTVNFYQRRE